MKKVLLITDVAFWSKNAGHCVRISQLVRKISQHVELTVAFLSLPHEIDEDALSREFSCRFFFPEKKKLLKENQYGFLLKTFLESREFDFCIVEFIHMSLYLRYLTKTFILILDIHDIVSDRLESFRKYQYEHEISGLSRDIEYKIFDLYNYIMVICEPDFEELSSEFNVKKLLLCPPNPAEITKKMNRRKVQYIGFVGSGYFPNKDAIQFFVNECWPSIVTKHDVILNIYGNVADKINNIKESLSIQIKGFVKNLDEIFEECDIMINPVRFGAGIKIKNIEALAHGLPLLTTLHGSRGLAEGVAKAFLIADNSAEFIGSLIRLIDNYELRKKLSQEAYKFIASHFSRDKCFEQLLKLFSES